MSPDDQDPHCTPGGEARGERGAAEDRASHPSSEAKIPVGDAGEDNGAGPDDGAGRATERARADTGELLPGTAPSKGATERARQARDSSAEARPGAPTPRAGECGPVHSLGQPTARQFDPDRPLRVVCWNAAKGRGARFARALEDLGQERAPGLTADLILLQEARDLMGTATPGVASFAHSWTGPGGGANGVMTLAPVAPLEGALNLRSRARELGWTSRKNCLITQHPVRDRGPLTVVNFHGINFRATARPFSAQLGDLAGVLATLPGPLIVGGDFNTWGRGRMLALLRFARTLGVTRVRPSAGQGKRASEWHVRTIGRPFRLDARLPLDHLLYRGLVLDGDEHPPRWVAELDRADHSDHVPLFASFRWPAPSPATV